MSHATAASDGPSSDRATRRVAAAQGTFYLITGLWPLLNMKSFEAVTGPKTDRWLVKTTGLLIAVIGATLLDAARMRRVPGPVALLGAGTAAALGASSIHYARRGRIAKVYLVDGAVELGFVAGWIVTAWVCRRASPRRSRSPRWWRSRTR